MQKKYDAPKLEKVGDLRANTKGQGLAGSDDQILFIRWGTDPS